MKKLSAYIFIILSSTFLSVSMAQVTAVMKASVNIISGASVTAIQNHNIQIDTNSEQFEFEAGSLVFKNSFEADVKIHFVERNTLTNESGNTLDINHIEYEKIDSPDGSYTLALKGFMNPKSDAKGNYNGAVTAVIEYL